MFATIHTNEDTISLIQNKNTIYFLIVCITTK